MLGFHSDAALMVLPTDPSDMKFEVNFNADWCVESTAFKMHCIKRLKAAQHLQISSSLGDAVLKSVWRICRARYRTVCTGATAVLSPQSGRCNESWKSPKKFDASLTWQPLHNSQKSLVPQDQDKDGPQVSHSQLVSQGVPRPVISMASAVCLGLPGSFLVPHPHDRCARLRIWSCFFPAVPAKVCAGLHCHCHCDSHAWRWWEANT